MTQRSKHTTTRKPTARIVTADVQPKTASASPLPDPVEVAKRHAADVQRLLETSSPEGREFMRLLTLDHLEKCKAELTPADLERLAKLQEPPAPAITPRPESPWEAGEVNRNASMLTLLVGMQEDHRGEHWPEDGPIGLLARVTRATTDDVEIIECVMNAGDGLDHSDAIVRILNRIRSRGGIALEVARRMEEGVL